jgi:hypothetical protein
MTYDTISQTFTGIAAIEITCWCSIHFVIPKSLYNYYQRKNAKAHGSYELHCPVGHTMIPAKANAATDALKRQLADKERQLQWERERATAQRARADRAEHRDRARKGVVTKLKKRIANGVCPCCHRTFTNVARHMKGQHPDWSPDDLRTEDGGGPLRYGADGTAPEGTANA